MGSAPVSDYADFYSSPYLAEHYDLICEDEAPFMKDVEIYWGQLHKIKELRKCQDDTDAFVVVDMGTGTGRVLEGLGRRATAEKADLSGAHFIGIDTAQAMLDRAAQKCDLNHVGTVSWCCSSAEKIAEVVESRAQNRLDLLIMAIGSFSHIWEPGHAERFFRGLARVLQPGSGRAFISLMDPKTLTSGEGLNFHDENGAAQEIQSRDYSGLRYRNTYIGREMDGDLGCTKYKFEVLKDGEVIEMGYPTLRGKVYYPEEFVSLLEQAGLQVLNTSTIGPETFYTISLR